MLFEERNRSANSLLRHTLRLRSTQRGLASVYLSRLHAEGQIILLGREDAVSIFRERAGRAVGVVEIHNHPAVGYRLRVMIPARRIGFLAARQISELDE